MPIFVHSSHQEKIISYFNFISAQKKIPYKLFKFINTDNPTNVWAGPNLIMKRNNTIHFLFEFVDSFVSPPTTTTTSSMHVIQKYFLTNSLLCSSGCRQVSLAKHCTIGFFSYDQSKCEVFLSFQRFGLHRVS